MMTAFSNCPRRSILESVSDGPRSRREFLLNNQRHEKSRYLRVASRAVVRGRNCRIARARTRNSSGFGASGSEQQTGPRTAAHPKTIITQLLRRSTEATLSASLSRGVSTPRRMVSSRRARSSSRAYSSDSLPRRKFRFGCRDGQALVEIRLGIRGTQPIAGSRTGRWQGQTNSRGCDEFSLCLDAATGKPIQVSELRGESTSGRIWVEALPLPSLSF